MALEIWEAALGAVGVTGAGGAGAFFGRRSRAERDASSAVQLAKAYSALVDDQREDISDARAHIHRQDEELAALRAELATVRQAHTDELAAVRTEVATVRAENQQLRTENQQLRTRLAQLERRDLAA
jgi:regulator of replication initiation timing